MKIFRQAKGCSRTGGNAWYEILEQTVIYRVIYSKDVTILTLNFQRVLTILQATVAIKTQQLIDGTTGPREPPDPLMAKLNDVAVA